MGELLNELYRQALALPEQASGYARSVDRLHYFEMTSMVLLTAIVAAVALRFCWRYRRRERVRTPRIVAPLSMELPVYGAILVFFVSLWIVGFRQYVAADDAPPDAMEIYVTAKQWMWKFAYPEAGVGSVGVLYVPADRPVRLLLTSRDVIHSFFLPTLRIKRDAVPGMYTSLWFRVPEPGRHRIFCAEMCGVGHSQMLGEVVVLPQHRFSAWITSQRALAEARTGVRADLADLGRAAAVEHGCLSCHAAGEPPPGVQLVGPSWVGVYRSEIPLLGGGTVIADEAYLTRSMMDPTAQIHAGFPPLMPSYQGLLEAPQVAAIVEFIKSLDEPADAQERFDDR